MLERVFKLSDNKTTVRTEIMAGITTFMTMAYILAVNPSILGSTGMDPTAVLLAMFSAMHSSIILLNCSRFLVLVPLMPSSAKMPASCQSGWLLMYSV